MNALSFMLRLTASLAASKLLEGKKKKILLLRKMTIKQLRTIWLQEENDWMGAGENIPSNTGFALFWGQL